MKVVLYKIVQNLQEYFGYFCKQICYQEDKNIAESGHTGRRCYAKFVAIGR